MGISNQQPTEPERQAASTGGGSPVLITVAICTRNRAVLMAQAVRSVLAQVQDDTEVMIVDNASTDDTAGVARAIAAENPLVTVWSEGELGLSAARNTALARARGQYLVFLDDDATAEGGWLEAYRRFLSAPPSARIGAVGGAVFPRYEKPPPAWVAPGTPSLNWSDQVQPFKERGGPWGCNFAVHRQRALDLGGFNTALGRKGNSMGANEESEVCQRLQLAGFELWWLPAARIRHLVPAERLNLRFQWGSEFSLGRSNAIVRAQAAPDARQRRLFVLGRLLVAPVHFLICTLAGFVAFPFRRGRTGVGLWLRAARVAGFAYQLALGVVAFRENPRRRR